MYALENAEPVWKELIPARGDNPPVEVQFLPHPSPIGLRKARIEVERILRAGGPDALDLAGDAFSRRLVRYSIIAWRGIIDADTGEQIAPTPDEDVTDDDGNVTGVKAGTISAFIANPRLMAAADREYVTPWVRRDAEKNGLSPSANGTSERATPADNTATTPATPDGSGGAATKKRASRSARMKSTSRAPRKGKRSGA